MIAVRLEITGRTDLAKRALMTLATNGGNEILKGAMLAERIGTTTNYLPQVMKPLVSNGWVVSEPGPRGGYRATQGAAVVSMLELIEAVEGPIVDGMCVLKDTSCPTDEYCALHEAWSEAREALMEVLRNTRASAGHPPNWPDSSLKGASK